MAQSFEQLQQKYENAISAARNTGHLQNVNMQGDKLFVRAEVASEDVKNSIWNKIKEVDPQYSDLIADITINPAVPAPQQAAAAGQTTSSQRTYTVKPGDSLSAIAQQFYGKASEYNRIFEANRDKLNDPNRVQAGQELVIPS